MKHAITSSYTPPDDSNGVVALANLDQWIEPGLKLEEGKLGLGFPFMYLLLTGSVGIKVPSLSVPCSYRGCPFFTSLYSIYFSPTVLQDLWVPSTHPSNCYFSYERCFGLGGTDACFLLYTRNITCSSCLSISLACALAYNITFSMRELRPLCLRYSGGICVAFRRKYFAQIGDDRSRRVRSGMRMLLLRNIEGRMEYLVRAWGYFPLSFPYLLRME